MTSWGEVLEAADRPPAMIIGAHRAEDTVRLQECSPGRSTAAFTFDPQRIVAHEKSLVEDVRRWAATRVAVRLPAGPTAVFGVSADAELPLAMGLRHPDIYGAVFCASTRTGYRPPAALPGRLPRTYVVAASEEPLSAASDVAHAVVVGRRADRRRAAQQHTWPGSGRFRVGPIPLPSAEVYTGMDNYYTLETFYRLSNGLSQLDPPLTLEERRVIDAHWGDVTAEPGGVDYLERELGGVPVLWAEPTKAVRDRVLLCLHGGGYVGGSVYTHRKMFAHLAKAVGARAVLPSYSHTPDRQYPTQLDEVTAVYRAILDSGVDPKHLAVTGDSAGGGMTVSLMLRAKAEGLPLAAALVPISPWTDMTQSGASVVTNRPTDLLFGADHPMDIHGLVTMLLPAGVSPSDPLVSPLFADLTGMPPMYVQVGGGEMLLDDAVRLEEAARRHGVEVELDVVPDEQHTFQMSAGHTATADAAIARVAAWLKARLGL
jgi:monoterpene epsilon-lactone hydrolase